MGAKAIKLGSSDFMFRHLIMLRQNFRQIDKDTRALRCAVRIFWFCGCVVRRAVSSLS